MDRLSRDPPRLFLSISSGDLLGGAATRVEADFPPRRRVEDCRQGRPEMWIPTMQAVLALQHVVVPHYLGPKIGNLLAKSSPGP